MEYIHALLIEKEQQTNETYKASRKLQREYEESETASKDLVERWIEAADEFMHKHFDALHALQDFEDQEWCQEEEW